MKRQLPRILNNRRLFTPLIPRSIDFFSPQQSEVKMGKKIYDANAYFVHIFDVCSDITPHVYTNIKQI